MDITNNKTINSTSLITNSTNPTNSNNTPYIVDMTLISIAFAAALLFSVWSAYATYKYNQKAKAKNNNPHQEESAMPSCELEFSSIQQDHNNKQQVCNMPNNSK